MGVVIFKSFAFGKGQDAGVCSKLAKKRIMGTIISSTFFASWKKRLRTFSISKKHLGPNEKSCWVHAMIFMFWYVLWGNPLSFIMAWKRVPTSKKKGADGSVLMTLQTSILTGASQKWGWCWKQICTIGRWTLRTSWNPWDLLFMAEILGMDLPQNLPTSTSARFQPATGDITTYKSWIEQVFANLLALLIASIMLKCCCCCWCCFFSSCFAALIIIAILYILYTATMWWHPSDCDAVRFCTQETPLWNSCRQLVDDPCGCISSGLSTKAKVALNRFQRSFIPMIFTNMWLKCHSQNSILFCLW